MSNPIKVNLTTEDYESERMVNDGVLSGYITKEFTHFGRGSISFTIRHYKRWLNKRTGEEMEKVSDFNVAAHDKYAEEIMDNASVGSYIAFIKEDTSGEGQTIAGHKRLFQGVQVNHVLYIKNKKGTGNG